MCSLKNKDRRRRQIGPIYGPIPLSLLHCLACMFCCMRRAENATDCVECAERERCSVPSRGCGWHMENNTCSEETVKRQRRGTRMRKGEGCWRQIHG